MTRLGRITVRRGSGEPTTIAIRDAIFRIGSGLDNHLVLDDEDVSAHHADIRHDGPETTIVDHGSALGTLVGVERALPALPLALADATRIQIGAYALVYRANPRVPIDARRPALPPRLSADSRSKLLEQLPTMYHEEASLGQLVVERPGGGVSETISIRNPVVRIGSDFENDVVLPDPAVADFQAEIRCAAEGIDIIRCPGASGMSLDALPMEIGHAYRLSARSAIAVGSWVLKYRRGEFLRRLLLIFESLWEPLERRHDFLEMYFDPRTCPESFLPWLASWCEAAIDPHASQERTRGFVLELMDLYRLRGTREGLVRLLELQAGVSPTIVEDAEAPLVLRITIPCAEDGDGVSRQRIEALINAHKPAHVGYHLEYSP